MISWKSPIFGCALMDEMRVRALAGDRLAIEYIVKWSARDVPPSAARAYRDVELKRLCAELLQTNAANSITAAADLIAEAGKILEASATKLRGRKSFARMGSDEVAAFEARIRAILKWSPKFNGSAWPNARRVLDILQS